MKLDQPKAKIEIVNVSYSQLATFRECVLKHHLRYNQKLKSPDRVARLDFGTAFHSVMEAHNTAILVGADQGGIYELTNKAVNKAVDLGLTDDDLDRLRWCYEGYVQQYGLEPEWLREKIEHWFDFVLCNLSIDEVAYQVKIRGKIDLVKRHRESGKRVVVDYKTIGGRDLTKGAWLSETELDDQFTLYHAAMVRGGEDVAYAEWDAIRSDRLKREMTLAERFARHGYFAPQGKLDSVWNDAAAAARSMIQMKLHPEQIYSSPDPRSCGWKCEFVRAHVNARSTGRDPAVVAQEYGFTVGGEPRTEESELEGGW